MNTRTRTRSGVSKVSHTNTTPKLQTKSKIRNQTVLCFCSKDDDGSPMILCSECKIWYHFICVDLSEPEAEEISVYVCPTCTATTGRRSALTWEGDQAVEECTDDDEVTLERRNAVLKANRKKAEVKMEIEESDDGPSSEDEYVHDKSGKNKSANRRRTRRFSSGSDSANSPGRRRLTRIKGSPSATQHGHLKRKATDFSESSPPSKKKRSYDAVDDPARKYCLGKLEELFRDVFRRYPHVRAETSDEDMDVNDNKSKIIPKKIGELSEEEKEALINEANQFAQDLENCIYDIYSEPDKQGNVIAGGKYKDRFRMLQFNLSKVDRVIIHQRITSGNISPKEISLMSSTDLADEETKQSIKIAEKEALEHSILQKSTAPRAKITHKGLQDIEDVNGEPSSARETERQREEEEERRERERMARLRTVQRQRTASVSVPPESPTVLQSPLEQWGAPPPVPLHAISPSDEAASSATSRVSMFTDALSTAAAESSSFVEPELNLADLINIDEDQETGVTSFSPPNRPAIVIAAEPVSSSPVDTSVPVLTGISPFAARPRAPSFDLNALWNASRNEPSTTPTEPSPPPTTASEVQSLDNNGKDDNMDLESQEANDQDFDMFLEEKEPEAPAASQVTNSQNVEALPPVWSGRITMPLDSDVPLETSLIARQVGGRHLSSESPLWRTLIPSDSLRIEGRVPVDNSSKYLLQMRLNASKELIATAFSPASEASEDNFNVFSSFLISKSRHGLVFPWGSRPKEYHPGRELYMIPLLKSEPLPEYMELLDELKLPKIRTSDYIVGIWILNKGKLVPLPVPPASEGLPAPQLALPAVKTTYSTPLSQSPPVPPSGLPIPPAIVAEVATLTPEQIQNVIQTLASTTRLPFSQVQQSQQPQQPPHMNPIHPSQPQTGNAPPIPQLWRSHPPAAFPNFPPQNPVGAYRSPPHGVNSLHSLGSPHSQPPANGPGPYERQEYSREFRGSPYDGEPGRGEQGWRGNHRGRGGRGRGARGDGFDSSVRRPVDSGWPRRPKNEGPAGVPSW